MKDCEIERYIYTTQVYEIVLVLGYAGVARVHSPLPRQ